MSCLNHIDNYDCCLIDMRYVDFINITYYFSSLDMHHDLMVQKDDFVKLQSSFSRLYYKVICNKVICVGFINCYVIMYIM